MRIAVLLIDPSTLVDDLFHLCPAQRGGLLEGCLSFGSAAALLSGGTSGELLGILILG